LLSVRYSALAVQTAWEFFSTDFITMQVAFHIWVHLDMGAKHDFNGLAPDVWLLGAVGAVRVAVRGLSASGSLLRPSHSS
jgi:hypothetical protein